MNLLEALISIRNAALPSDELNKTALKVINKKIASLERKKAWRETPPGEVPDHAKHPGHPLNNYR